MNKEYSMKDIKEAIIEYQKNPTAGKILIKP